MATTLAPSQTPNQQSQADPALINADQGTAQNQSTTTPNPQTLADWYKTYQSSQPPTPTAPAATWAPESNSTVQGQLKGILDAGGPLMTQAETRALQQMNARGLLNSSMAVGAGQSALYEAAMPIAQADAGTYATSQRENTAAENASRQQAAGFKQQSNLQAADIGNQQVMQSKDLASRYDLANLDATTRMKLQEADAANQQKLQASDQVFKANLQTQSLDVQQSMQKYNLAVQQAMQGKDNETKMAIATLDANTQEKLADINNQYKVQLQASASMSNTFSQLTASIAQVMADPNMDAEAKTNYIKTLTDTYSANMEMQSTITGLDLGKLMIPGSSTTTPTTTPVTTPSTTTETPAATNPILAPENSGWFGLDNMGVGGGG